MPKVKGQKISKKTQGSDADPKTSSGKRFQFQWYDENEEWRLWLRPVQDDSTTYYCLACKEVRCCSKSRVSNHELSTKHKNRIKLFLFDMERQQFLNASVDSSNPLSFINVVKTPESGPKFEFGPAPEYESTDSHLDCDHLDDQNPPPQDDAGFTFNERANIAEIRLALFLVEHNISFNVGSELIELLKEFGREPALLQRITLGSTKLTKIVNNVLAPHETNRITEILRVTKFSTYVDETSDITNEKWLTLLAKYVGPKDLVARTELLKMINLDASDGSAAKVYECFRNELWSKKIAMTNILSSAVDNTSSMIGKNNSFQSRLAEVSPVFILMQCVCHLSALVASAACKAIPANIEELMRGIPWYFNTSPKKTAIFRQMMVELEDHAIKMKKFAQTRWLSRHPCVKQLLELFPSLQCFFLEQASEKISKAQDIMDIMQIPQTLAYLKFLDFVLEPLHAFNAKFQGRDTLVQDLQPSSEKLLLWFVQKFCSPSALVSDTVAMMDFAAEKNHSSDINVGASCQDFLDEQVLLGTMSQEDVDVFKANCLQFFVTASLRIQKDLPHNNPTFHQIAVLRGQTALLDSNRHSTFHSLVLLSKRLNITDSKWLNSLLCEWEKLFTIQLVLREEWAKLPFDDMWVKICSLKNAANEIVFPHLRTLTSLVRTLPHSNAEAERAFSIIPDAKNRKRNCLSNESVNAICVIRFALKSRNLTALTMSITREHLALMPAECLYASPKSSAKEPGKLLILRTAEDL